MNPQIPLETEIKLRLQSIGTIPSRLDQLGFRLETPSQLERSVLWDRGTELFDQGCALRMRIYAGRTLITWKGKKIEDPLLKIRPELETSIDDAAAMEGILQALGLHPVFTMEKTRAVWRRPDLVACLDETPFGAFLELEGDPSAIHPVMKELGLGPEAAENRSYPTLFRENGLA